MKNPELLCLGCMEELERPGDTCRKCGFNRTEYEKNRNVHTLPSYTILAGKYLLGRVLGEGGFGITYIAWDLNRECRVAIKEYFPSGLATRDTRFGDGEALTIMPGEKAAYYRNGLKNFAEEGKNLARFQELPGIVSVRDFFQDNGTAYIVMDYVEGKNLKQYLREHYEKNGEHAPMAENQILEMMRPVLQALSEIHKAGIIHRDISPENIICGSDGKITLIDFGAARAAVGTETKSLTIMLKHGYAPEEQYRTHGKQGPWTDIYAICATMYQMASGYLPAESIERMYEDQLQPLKKANPKVSGEFSDVIQKGMAVRGEMRYQSIEEMYEILYPEPEEQQIDEEEVKEAGDEKIEAEGIEIEEPELTEPEIDVEEVMKWDFMDKLVKWLGVVIIIVAVVLVIIAVRIRINEIDTHELKAAKIVENETEPDEMEKSDVAEEQEESTEEYEKIDAKIIDIPLTEEQYSFAVSNKRISESEYFLDEINDFISEVKVDGALERICRAYYGFEEQEALEYYGSTSDADVQNRVKRNQISVAVGSPDDSGSVFAYREDNQYLGVDIELIKLFADRYGYQLFVEEMEYDSLMQALESGECDMAIGALVAKEEWEGYATFSDVYFDASYQIVVRNNELTIHSWEINAEGTELSLQGESSLRGESSGNENINILVLVDQYYTRGANGYAAELVGDIDENGDQTVVCSISYNDNTWRVLRTLIEEDGVVCVIGQATPLSYMVESSIDN